MKFFDHFKSQARLLYENGSISYEEYVIMRSDSRFSRAIVVSAVIMITFYMVVMCQFTYLDIKSHASVFPPVEFTTGYFAFWTVEVVMLATLRRSKVKNKHEADDPKADIIRNVITRISSGGDKEESKPEPVQPETTEITGKGPM